LLILLFNLACGSGVCRISWKAGTSKCSFTIASILEGSSFDLIASFVIALMKVSFAWEVGSDQIASLHVLF